MTTGPRSPGFIVPEASRLYLQLRSLAECSRRMVFVAGLPGTGKSLLIHQLAHLAAATGRTVHLLQWDTARPVFEASPAGRRYPVVDGVTHGAVRKAAGWWVRRALVEWERRHPDPRHMVVGETPLVGARFIELARPAADAAEPLLTAPTTVFVIPVPSREVRERLHTERARRAARPLHDREREDAPPPVLRDLWRELGAVAVSLGIAPAAPVPSGDRPYDPDLYRQVYERLLRHRRVEVVPLETWLAAATFSVYDFAITRSELSPTPEEATAFIRQVEARYPDPDTLQREIDGWYRV